MRLLLKTGLGILMAGVLCALLLVGAYLALVKTPAPLAYAQAVEIREEAARAAPTADAPPRAFHPPVRIVTPADRRALELADEIRRSEDDAERAELREQLVSALAVAFDERRERQRKAIDDLEKQLDDLRALYAERGERKDEIVQRRVSELLAEPDVLAWDPAPRVGGPGVLRLVEPVPADAPSAPERSPIAPEHDPIAPAAPRMNPSAPRAPFAPNNDPFAPPAAKPGTPREKGTARDDNPFSPARSEASPLGDAAQILELLAELRQIEAELETGIEGGIEAARGPEAKQRLQLARAKLEIAEISWAHTEQMLRNRVEAAKAKLEPAEIRLTQMKTLHQRGVTPAFEVLDAEVKFKQAAAELQAAESLLRAWQMTDAILREHRDASETGPEESQEEGNAERSSEQETKAETAVPQPTLDQ